MAQKASVGKLVKDFEKVRTIVPSLSSSASLVKVSTETDNGPDTFQRIIPGESNAGATRSGKDKFSGQQQQQLMVQSVLSGQEIDDAIVAERERDIKKLNQDLAAVNELFK